MQTHGTHPGMEAADQAPAAVVGELLRRWATGERATDLFADDVRHSGGAVPPFCWVPDEGGPEEHRRSAEAAGIHLRARRLAEGAAGWVMLETIWTMSSGDQRGSAGMVWLALRAERGRLSEFHVLPLERDARALAGIGD